MAVFRLQAQIEEVEATRSFFLQRGINTVSLDADLTDMRAQLSSLGGVPVPGDETGQQEDEQRQLEQQNDGGSELLDPPPQPQPPPPPRQPTGEFQERWNELSSLPPGWQRMQSRSTGRDYYYCTLTGESTFERPTTEEEDDDCDPGRHLPIPNRPLGLPARIVAVVGRPGAGIGPVVHWLRNRFDRKYSHVHMGDNMVAVACETGRRLTELRQLSATEVRSADGRSVIDAVMHEARARNADTVIEGVGCDPAAVRSLKRNGVTVIQVMAPVETRFERLRPDATTTTFAAATPW